MDEHETWTRRHVVAWGGVSVGAGLGASVAGVSDAAVAARTRPPAAVVDNAGKDGLSRLSIRDFGVTGRAADETAAVQRALAAAQAAAPCVLTFDGLTIRIGVASLSTCKQVILDGEGAVITPPDPVGATDHARSGRIEVRDADNVVLRGFSFVQAAHAHYEPVLAVLGSRQVMVEDCTFRGCGAGMLFQGCTGVTARNNRLEQVGVLPRPKPLAAVIGPGGTVTDSRFGQAYEHYGFGIRCVLCTDVVMTSNRFRNDAQGSGAVSDGAGGAGGLTAHECDNVLIDGNTVINAPGQGILLTGAWQGTNVVRDHRAGTFNPEGRGRFGRIVNNYVEGCNQEGITVFGCGETIVADNVSQLNRFAGIEIWQSWSATVTGNSCWNPVAGAYRELKSGVGGSGAVHLVDCYDFLASGNRIRESRTNGLFVAGSRVGLIANNVIHNYGSACGTLDFASGIAFNYSLIHQPDLPSSDIGVTGNIFLQAVGNRAGFDLWANFNDPLIRQASNMAIGRDLTIGGGVGSFRSFMAGT